MGKINFIKSQRPHSQSPFDGVYNDGGGLTSNNILEVKDGDNTFYLTYIDSTHFFLSNSKEYKGNAYHIGQFRSRPFYDEVKSWLSSNKNKFNDGGQTNEEQNRAMILSQAKEVAHHVSELNEIMTKQPDIDAWVIAKMQDVTTGLSDITHYLDGRVGFRLGADDVSERMKEMLKDGGETKFMKGGVAGDVYSLQNPKQFKQVITIYNDLTEKTDLIKGYYLDHTDNSIVFLTEPNISDVGKDEIFRYVELLKEKDFSIINWKKTMGFGYGYSLNWGTEKGSMVTQYLKKGRANPRWFKLYLIDRIKYKAGGEIILGGGSMASVQDSILANGAKLDNYRHKIVRFGAYPKVGEFFLDTDSGWIYQSDMRNLTLEEAKKAADSPKNANLEVVVVEDDNGGYAVLTRSRSWGRRGDYKERIYANGAKLPSGKLTLSKLKSMIEEYNSEGRNFELLGAYNQLELWSNDNRIEAGSKEDIYRALVRYRFNPKYANGAELSDIDSMTDEEIITFANTLSYYDRMDEGIEEEFDNVEDAKEYLRMMAESE